MPKQCSRKKSLRVPSSPRPIITSYRQQYISMKRKLNENDVPEEVSSTSGAKESGTSSAPSFEALGLDARLLQAIATEKYATPTPVQAKAIPLALEGRDILGPRVCPFVTHQMLTPYYSTSKDWLRQDSRICSTHPPIYPQTSLQHELDAKHNSHHLGSYEGARQSGYEINLDLCCFLCKGHSKCESYTTNLGTCATSTTCYIPEHRHFHTFTDSTTPQQLDTRRYGPCTPCG